MSRKQIDRSPLSADYQSTRRRILECLAAGESLQTILLRPGITDADLTAVVREFRLRVTPDGELEPRSAHDLTSWRLTLGAHSPNHHVQTAAMRARNHLDALTTLLAADQKAHRGRSVRTLQVGAVRSWKMQLRAMVREADDEIKRLSQASDLRLADTADAPEQIAESA